MSTVPAIVLPALELDHEDLVTLLLGHHFSRHLGRGQRRGLYRHLPVVADEEDLRELYRRAGRRVEPLDFDHLTRSHPILLSTRRDNRFHDCSSD